MEHILVPSLVLIGGFDGRESALAPTIRSLDSLSREVAHTIFDKCRRCGNTRDLEVSHFIRRGVLSTRWSPINLDVLCRKCHTYFEMHPGIEYDKWKASRDGRKVVESLLELARVSAAYKARYSKDEFMSLTKKSLSEVLDFARTCDFQKDLYTSVFVYGLGIVPILE